MAEQITESYAALDSQRLQKILHKRGARRAGRDPYDNETDSGPHHLGNVLWGHQCVWPSHGPRRNSARKK